MMSTRFKLCSAFAVGMKEHFNLNNNYVQIGCSVFYDDDL